MFKVIIAGGRNFHNYSLLSTKCNKILSNINDDIEVVCGGAKGADTLGEIYAKSHKYGIKYFFADWSENGKYAGYIRNEEMGNYADALIAFWDGKSKGTKHMINYANKRGIPYRIIRY